MAIVIAKEAKKEAIASIERYFREHMDEPIGNVAAGGLLNFMLEEIAPLAYNQGVADAQERMAIRVSEVDIDIHEDAFQFWRKADKRR